MTRMDYLMKVASLKRQHAEGWITAAEWADRISDLMHEYTETPRPGEFEQHVTDALKLVQVTA